MYDRANSPEMIAVDEKRQLLKATITKMSFDFEDKLSALLDDMPESQRIPYIRQGKEVLRALRELEYMLHVAQSEQDLEKTRELIQEMDFRMRMICDNARCQSGRTVAKKVKKRDDSNSIPAALETYEPAPQKPYLDGTSILPEDRVCAASPSGVLWGVFNRLFAKRKRQNALQDVSKVYSSVFAPAEVRRKSHMLVQVYLHLYEETEMVKHLAMESRQDAERRDYIPLQCGLKKGDIVEVRLNIYGQTLLASDSKSVVWQGSFTKCSFDYFVPADLDVDELSCAAQLSLNGLPVGEMRFVTRIVVEPRKLHPEVIACQYKRVFISYAHQDEERVKFFPEGLKLAGVDYFFDRHYLTIGSVFPKEIQNYINTADLFVLFWSENASKSEYVKKERELALKRAYPQIKPLSAARLSIYPMSIEPRAELPEEMRAYYHFGEL